MSTSISSFSLLLGVTDIPLLEGSINESVHNVSGDSKNFKNCLTSYCIPMTLAISIIAVCGIIANGIVISVIAKNKRLHKATFMAIASLSLSDFLFLLLRYVRHLILGYFVKVIPRQTVKIIKSVCDVGGLTAGGSSIIHVVLLSVLRYYIVVHPLKSHISVTNKRILLVSLCVWIISALLAVFYFYFVVINRENDVQMSKTTNIVVTLVMSILPLVIIALVHVLKARKLRNSLAACKRNTTKQMSQIVTFVIVAYIVTTTPANVKDILVISWGHARDHWMLVFGQVGRLMLFLNYAINPFIYFVHSPQFRKYTQCRKKHDMHYVSSNGTSYSTASMSHSTEVTMLPEGDKNTHL